jgi:hypothetical protein
LYTQWLVLTHSCRSQILAIQRFKVFYLRNLAIILSLFCPVFAHASDPGLTWGTAWTINVHEQYCSLTRSYRISVPSDPARRGFLSETIYNGASLQFSGNAEIISDDANADDLGGMQFYLTISAADWPVETEKLIIAADIGGINVVPFVSPKTGEHSFVLDPDRALLVYRQFMDSDSVDFTLYFSNDETRQFSVRSRIKGRFKLWAAMFQTCIRENRDQRR